MSPARDPGRSALAFAREAYRALALYDPQRSPCEVDLSDNTNLFGVPPAARRALAEADGDAVTRYPAVYARSLKEAIAAYASVPVECVVTGCGSDDVLDSAIRAFSEPGERLAYPDPTFAMVPSFATMNGLAARPVPLGENGVLDAAALVAARAEVVYLCSPNNPTGRAFAPEAIRRTIAEASRLVILDQAYAEFDDGATPPATLVSEHPNLLVTRTLSKAFGLAGLRIGFGVGAPELVAEVEKSRGPFKVGGLAERAAVAALTADRDWVRERIAEVRVLRERFSAALGGHGFEPLPSDANFVLVPVAAARDIAARMRRSGVGVRPFPALPRIGDAVRITIGPWVQMERALAALREAVT